MSPFYCHQKIVKAAARIRRPRLSTPIKLPSPRCYGELLAVLVFAYLFNSIVGLVFVQGRLL